MLQRLPLPAAPALLALLCAASPTAAPDDIVRAIYQNEVKADALFVKVAQAREAHDEAAEHEYLDQYAQTQKHHPYFNATQREHFFSARLTELAQRDEDEAQLSGQKVRLDIDPISGSQEPNVTQARVSAALIDKDMAKVNVQLVNWDKPEILVYSFAQENGQWKISNIVVLDANGHSAFDLLQTLSATPPPVR